MRVCVCMCVCVYVCVRDLALTPRVPFPDALRMGISPDHVHCDFTDREAERQRCTDRAGVTTTLVHSAQDRP